MKKYYSFRDYQDVPQWYKDIIYKFGWRRIPGFPKPEYYNLNSGRLAYVFNSKLRERKKGINKDGYSTTKFKWWDGSFKSLRTNRIALDFVHNPERKPYGHHKDHDRANNAAANIEPATPKENANK